MSDGRRLTPTQQRMYDILKDGLPHKREELRATIGDPLAENHHVAQHVSDLRRSLRREGLDVVCVSEGRRNFYRIFRVLEPGYPAG